MPLCGVGGQLGDGPLPCCGGLACRPICRRRLALRAGCGGSGICPAVGGGIAEFFFHGIDDEAGDLGGQDAEIIREDDEEDPQEKAPAIFPEIFIYGPQVLH